MGDKIYQFDADNFNNCWKSENADSYYAGGFANNNCDNYQIWANTADDGNKGEDEDFDWIEEFGEGWPDWVLEHPKERERFNEKSAEFIKNLRK